MIFATIMLYMGCVESDLGNMGYVPTGNALNADTPVVEEITTDAELQFDDVQSWGRAVAQVFPWAADRAISEPSEWPVLFSSVSSQLHNILSNASHRDGSESMGSKESYLQSLDRDSQAILDRGINNIKTWKTLIEKLGWTVDVSKSALEKGVDEIIAQNLVPDLVNFGANTGRGEMSSAAVIYTNPIDVTEFQRKIAMPLLLNGFKILHQVQHPARFYQGSSRGNGTVQAVFTHPIGGSK